ncbi:uncharacterized protein B0I36DRAFT_435098 [Microdochium trichocladiopsis]|uniref:Uncharacterized protein n=1 Tax=Microdochium trichocladiopsis TaxID=1682393 RepID=A0A9P8XW24_9PEZI|nr:uncharacterized protein B0I36DRAFT_435098 [Microdochium trichocladiopsis]KAH7021228.1 hypothetical protein B0I36DRAFT_435098 [Microdochium trichocladiopsis]
MSQLPALGRTAAVGDTTMSQAQVSIERKEKVIPLAMFVRQRKKYNRLAIERNKLRAERNELARQVTNDVVPRLAFEQVQKDRADERVRTRTARREARELHWVLMKEAEVSRDLEARTCEAVHPGLNPEDLAEVQREIDRLQLENERLNLRAAEYPQCNEVEYWRLENADLQYRYRTIWEEKQELQAALDEALQTAPVEASTQTLASNDGTQHVGECLDTAENHAIESASAAATQENTQEAENALGEELVTKSAYKDQGEENAQGEDTATNAGIVEHPSESMSTEHAGTIAAEGAETDDDDSKSTAPSEILEEDHITGSVSSFLPAPPPSRAEQDAAAAEAAENSADSRCEKCHTTTETLLQNCAKYLRDVEAQQDETEWLERALEYEKDRNAELEKEVEELKLYRFFTGYAIARGIVTLGNILQGLAGRPRTE